MYRIYIINHCIHNKSSTTAVWYCSVYLEERSYCMHVTQLFANLIILYVALIDTRLHRGNCTTKPYALPWTPDEALSAILPDVSCCMGIIIRKSSINPLAADIQPAVHQVFFLPLVTLLIVHSLQSLLWNITTLPHFIHPFIHSFQY